MAIRKIHEVGDPCLTKVCRPVTEFNDRLHELLDDMADTLEEAGGVGLAAPQVGILRRVCIVEDEQGEIIELINPEIIKTEGEQTGLEGCLSVPGKYGIVTRPMVVRVRAQDRYGTEFEVEDEELTARCFCHEIEHLDGHLYTEHCKVLTDEELEQYIREQERSWTRNEDRLHGHARLCAHDLRASGRGWARRVRRFHAAGQAAQPKQSHAKPCKGICFVAEYPRFSAGDDARRHGA